MSRAFVNEDAASGPEPRYVLPEPDSEHYDRAAAHALIDAANAGHRRSAEEATGCRWGEPRLAPDVAEILEQADERGDERIAQLARRFLRRAEELAVDEAGPADEADPSDRAEG